MRPWKISLFILAGFAAVAIAYGVQVIRRGFSAADQPSAIEQGLARAARNWGIPRSARNEKNPWTVTPALLDEARENFLNHCAGCHGRDGDGQSGVGQNLYPRAAALRQPATQRLTDGEIHYIIQNGVRLTGMPALGNPHGSVDAESAGEGGSLFFFFLCVCATVASG